MQDLKNIYKINDSTSTASNSPTYIPPGIHENLRLVEVKKDVSPTGKDFYAFYFENENGDKVSYTEWALRIYKEPKDMSKEELEAFLRKVEFQASRIKQIIDVFKPGCSIEGTSFVDMMDKALAFLGDSYKTVLVRAKVVFDRNGFTTLSSNPISTFIESMDIPKDKSKIRILPSDKMTRENSDDEKVENNPVDNLVESNDNTSKDNTDNFPF